MCIEMAKTVRDNNYCKFCVNHFLVINNNETNKVNFDKNYNTERP